MLAGLEGAVANASNHLGPLDAYVVPEWGDVIVIEGSVSKRVPAVAWQRSFGTSSSGERFK